MYQEADTKTGFNMKVIFVEREQEKADAFKPWCQTKREEKKIGEEMSLTTKQFQESFI